MKSGAEKVLCPDQLILSLWCCGKLNDRQIIHLACLCGRLSLKYVPKNEKRPFKAYEAAEAWVQNPTESRKAAAAGAAWAAFAAADKLHINREKGKARRIIWDAIMTAAEVAWAIGSYTITDAANAVEAVGTNDPRNMCNLIRTEIKKPEFKNLSRSLQP